MGRPPTTKERRLQQTADYGILVDPEDEWLLEVMTWYVHRTGYVTATLYPERQMVFLHHYIVGFPVWKADEVDHANGNKLDNRRSNVSIKTVYANKQNRDTVRNAVNIHVRSNGTWEVKIHRNGERYRETFQSMDEAVTARDNWFATH